MNDLIVLRYRRDPGAETSTGEIVIRRDGAEESVEPFEQESFAQLLYRISRLISVRPEASVILERTDRGGLVPFKLDRATVDLIRTDPVAAVAAMTFPGSPTTAIAHTREKSVVPMLKAGTDLLADAFGDVVFVRFRQGAIECPGCGLWGTTLGEEFRCTKRCNITLRVRRYEHWASVPTSALLSTDLARFFFPRAWNGGRPWITKQALESLYQQFLSERDSACSA